MRLGSLFSGYGGLDMAVENVTGATTAWVSDIDKGARKILAHRYPDVPNLGDISTVDWSQVEPVDVLTGGYPCQPFSQAGQRKGLDDERHLWPYVRQAIRHLRPRLVVLENVAGHRSMGFDRVLGDLAEDGLHARWASLRAADVGAPHGRERLFIIVADPRRSGRLEALQHDGRSASAENGSGVPDERDRLTGRPRPRRVALLPTPVGTDAIGARNATAERPNGNGKHHTGTTLTDVVWQGSWGQYAAAIARWEHTLGRPAPAPTEPTGRTNAHRLSPAFVEWMMGLPAGWVTDVPELTRNEQLKALGNGVVPQQAEAALRLLLPATEAAA